MSQKDGAVLGLHSSKLLIAFHTKRVTFHVSVPKPSKAMTGNREKGNREKDNLKKGSRTAHPNASDRRD